MRRGATPRTVAWAVVVGLVLGGCGGPSAAELDGRLDELRLPTGYALVENAPTPSHHADWKPYAFRRYSIPSGAQPCADVEAAFEEWAAGSVDRYDDSRGCTFVSDDEEPVARANVDAAATRVLVETYAVDEPLIHF